MFECSIEKNDLRYTEYYGDGDTKSHSAGKDVYEESKVSNKNALATYRNVLGKDCVI